MKSSFKLDKKALDKVIRNTVESYAYDQTYEVACPHCGKTIQIPPGLSTCPMCGEQIDLNLDFKF